MHTADHSHTIIEIKDLCYKYGQENVLDNVTFQIHKGDYLGLIGPNGGGKTTLVKIILGLLKPQKGSVIRNDISRIGYVPQVLHHAEAPFPVSVNDVTAMGIYGKDTLFRSLTKEDNEKINSALRLVHMHTYKNRLLSQLSGGQQQRVYIARAIVNNPDVLILDEPTAGIDVQTQEEFYILLKDLHKQLGVTLILVSHELDVVARETTEVACLNQKLVYHGDPEEFFTSEPVKNLYGKEMSFLNHNH